MKWKGQSNRPLVIQFNINTTKWLSKTESKWFLSLEWRFLYHLPEPYAIKFIKVTVGGFFCCCCISSLFAFHSIEIVFTIDGKDDEGTKYKIRRSKKSEMFGQQYLRLCENMERFFLLSCIPIELKIQFCFCFSAFAFSHTVSQSIITIYPCTWFEMEIPAQDNYKKKRIAYKVAEHSFELHIHWSCLFCVLFGSVL